MSLAWSSVPRRNALRGPTGWSVADRRSGGCGPRNCWYTPCPVIAATTGAKIATSTMRMMIPREIIAARSCRSRSQASRHGLRPSIFFAASPSAAGTAPMVSSRAVSACPGCCWMLNIVSLSLRAGSGAGYEPGLDHALVSADAGPGLRDVLAVLDREEAGRAVVRLIAEPRLKLRHLLDASLTSLGAARVEPAARRRADRRWHVPDQDDPLPAAGELGGGDRDRRQQRVGGGGPRVPPELAHRRP